MSCAWVAVSTDEVSSLRYRHARYVLTNLQQLLLLVDLRSTGMRLIFSLRRDEDTTLQLRQWTLTNGPLRQTLHWFLRTARRRPAHFRPNPSRMHADYLNVRPSSGERIREHDIVQLGVPVRM